MNDHERKRSLMHSRVTLGAFTDRVDNVLKALRDMQAGYPTSSGTSGGRGTTRLDMWCDTHEAEDCGCGGTPVPAVSDPTGETALAMQDKAAKELERVDWLIGQVRKHVVELDQIRMHWLGSGKAARHHAKEGCEICSRCGGHNDVLAYSDVKGKLSRKYRLCRWHWEFVDETGNLPEPWQTKDYLAGKRVYRRAS